MHDAGFVGVKYDGAVDGECYVIFDENDAKIVGHDLFGVKGAKEKTVVEPTTVLISFKKDVKLSLETRSLLKAGNKRPFTRSGFYSLSNHLSGAKVNKNSQTIKILEKIKNWDIDDCKMFALLISNLSF